MPSWAALTPHDEYIRAARRLRGRYADRADELHRRLKELSDVWDGARHGADRAARPVSRQGHVARSHTPSVAPVASPLPRAEPEFAFPVPDTAAGQQFARLVQSRIHSGILRYSHRLDLLDHARRMGIERFQANLIIASVQHRMRQAIRTDSAVARSHSRAYMIAAALAVQSAIVGGTWWAFFR